jgi:hypothetical protein
MVSRAGVRLKAIGLEIPHQDILRTVMFDVLLSAARENMSALALSRGPTFLASPGLKDIQVQAEPQNKTQIFVRKGSVVVRRVSGQKGGTSLRSEVGQEGSFRGVKGRQDLPVLTPIPGLGEFFLFCSLGTED